MSFTEFMSHMSENDEIIDILSNGFQSFTRTNHHLIDIVENDIYVHVYIEIPGIKPDTIDVDIINNIVRVKGIIEKPYNNDMIIIKNERTYGHFEKVLTIPYRVISQESVVAIASDGVLDIRIQKQNDNTPSESDILRQLREQTLNYED